MARVYRTWDEHLQSLTQPEVKTTYSPSALATPVWNQATQTWAGEAPPSSGRAAPVVGITPQGVNPPTPIAPVPPPTPVGVAGAATSTLTGTPPETPTNYRTTLSSGALPENSLKPLDTPTASNIPPYASAAPSLGGTPVVPAKTDSSGLTNYATIPPSAIQTSSGNPLLPSQVAGLGTNIPGVSSNEAGVYTYTTPDLVNIYDSINKAWIKGGGDTRGNAPSPIVTPAPIPVPDTNPTGPITYETGLLPNYSYNPSTNLTGVYSGLFKPLRKQIGEQYDILGNAVGKFNATSAPYLGTFGGAAKSYIEEALRKGPGSPEWVAATDWINANYKEPTLDTDVLTTFAPVLQGESTALSTPEGTQDLLTQVHPDLTRGELRFESPRVFGDPGYNAGVKTTQADIAKIIADIQDAQSRASTATGAAKAKVGEVATKAKDYLTGQTAAQSKDWANRVTSTENQATQLKNIVENLKTRNPDLVSYSDLAQIPEANRVGWKPEDFYNPLLQKKDKAIALHQAIFDKYPDLAGVPSMIKGTNAKGKEAFRFPDQWFAANKDKYTSAQMADLKRRARERDLELIQNGFDPITEVTYGYGPIPPAEGFISTVTDKNGMQVPPPNYPGLGSYEFGNGLLGDVLPLYFGSEWKPGVNPASYLSTYGGGTMKATPENVATNPEIARYNAVLNLLGAPHEDFTAATTPYQGPQFGADTTSFNKAIEGSHNLQLERIKDAVNAYVAAGGIPANESSPVGRIPTPAYETYPVLPFTKYVAPGTPEALALKPNEDYIRWQIARGIL